MTPSKKNLRLHLIILSWDFNLNQGSSKKNYELHHVYEWAPSDIGFIKFNPWPYENMLAKFHGNLGCLLELNKVTMDPNLAFSDSALGNRLMTIRCEFQITVDNSASILISAMQWPSNSIFKEVHDPGKSINNSGFFSALLKLESCQTNIDDVILWFNRP